MLRTTSILVTVCCLLGGYVRRVYSVPGALACSQSDFVCTSGGCVDGSKRCNGIIDCNDESDENCCNQNSNAGKEFVFGFLPNYNSVPNLVLFLTASKDLNYTITCPGASFAKSGFLHANALVSEVVPGASVMPVGKGKNGFVVTATEDLVIYGLNQVRYTTDAFLALPSYIQRFEYVVASYGGRPGSSVGVVAIEDSTTVTLLPSVTLSGGGLSYASGRNHTIQMQRLDTLVLKGTDVTGTRVFSDKIITVFGGHDCVNVPSSKTACDHIVEQMPPVETLGKRYAVAPLATRTAGDVYRVIAARDGTDVFVNGNANKRGMSAGSYYEFEGSSSSYLSIEMSKPALLVQFSKGSSADRVLSDPFMMIIPPIEQYRFSYTISTPASAPVPFSSFVGIIVESGEESGIRLDGVALPSLTIWNDVPGQKLKGTTISIATGAHTVQHVSPIVKFGLTVYGFASYDSYGYPGGLQLQAECAVKPSSSDINECAPNNGTGPCQHFCTNTFGSFQCSCRDGFLLEPDLRSCGRSLLPCSCKNKGICRKGGFCECRPGWGGYDCSEPQCHLQNLCSGRGKCVAPNKCRCNAGWTGFACSVDKCPQYRTCSSCAAVPQCGWCDSSRRCMRGDGNGPRSQLVQCAAWFPYACVAVVSGQGNWPILNRFSSRIKIINCDWPCSVLAVRRRGNSVDAIGSDVWCRRRRRACLDYYGCFVSSIAVQCFASGRRAVACRVFSESSCSVGRPPASLPALPSPTKAPPVPTTPTPQSIPGLGPIIINANPVLTPLNLEFHIVCATGKEMSSWEGYGCWCDQSSYDHPLSVRLPVDKTDTCCHGHKLCYDKGPANCDCHSKSYGVYSPTCASWKEQKGYCNDVYLLDRSDLCRKHCCECDYKAAQCLKDNLPTKRDDVWKGWLTPSKGQCTPTCGKTSRCPCDKECSGHGVITGYGIDSFCLCFPGWQGQCCDQVDCSCRNSRGSDCSGNGNCRAASGDGNPSCRCRRGWRGRCCNRRIPVRRSGDPHIVTADGNEFDYFGIGEFWDCRSLINDFAAQIRFFGHKGTSFVGGVALKTGNVTTSIFTLDSVGGKDKLPKIRINGTLVSTDWSMYPSSFQLSPDVRLYVEPTRANGSVSNLVFQFTSGAVYSANVRFSTAINRQYLDTEFGPTGDYLQETEGLCGYMDNDETNDFVGPKGESYQNSTDFVESWRIASRGVWSHDWSWTDSNFHPDDALGPEYTNPFHHPVYGVNQLSANVRAVAEAKCKALGISGILLENCILDHGLTGDDSVLQQPAYNLKNCPNECSNRGYCYNGTCVCIDLWTGSDCSEGGCSNCPMNSQCQNGFCVCNVGYYGENCTKALCNGLNNCTSAVHGVCVTPDTCSCNPGYTGADCSQKTFCTHDCSGKGICLGNEKCSCNFDWAGSKCDEASCESSLFCSGNGMCLSNGTCDCVSGWQGSACDQLSCSDLNDCNGNGDCIGDNLCTCYTGYTGADCSLTTICPAVANCTENGICLDNATCLCFSGYYGDNCEKFECTKGCSGRGTCEAPEICSCVLGWTGSDCSTPSCEQLHYCSGHGRCAGVNLCVCDENWTGALCNTFTCSSSNRSGNCSLHGNCSAPGQCSCSSNYCGDDCEHSIIDECKRLNPCSHTCTDTCESYICSCLDGYQLEDDDVTCTDINECNNTAFSFRLNNCDQLCTNTPGSYVCSCESGYYLGKDKGSCFDVDECSTGVHKCEQLCTNTVGSYTCSCRSGFVSNKDGVSCDDVNECSLDIDGCDEICTNSIGSYVCSCDPDRLLGVDGKSCEDPPTASMASLSLGLVNVTIANTTENTLSMIEDVFSPLVQNAVKNYCVEEEGNDNPCNIISDAEVKFFYHMYAYMMVYNGSGLMISFYASVYNVQTRQLQVVPASELALAIQRSLPKFKEAKFDVADIAIGYPMPATASADSPSPSAETTVQVDVPDGELTQSARVTIIVVATVGGISLVLLIAITVFFLTRSKSSKRTGVFEPGFEHTGHKEGVAVSNPVYGEDPEDHALYENADGIGGKADYDNVYDNPDYENA